MISEEFKLTSSQVYELRSQYEILKKMGEHSENTDIQVLGGNSKLEDPDQE